MIAEKSLIMNYPKRQGKLKGIFLGGILMITKIKADRHYLFDPAAHIVMRVEINGKPNILTLKKAIVWAVAKHDILNCTIKMDAKGDCYYVPRDYAYIPKIEVCKGIVSTNEIVNKQCKKEFKIDQGDIVRFVIAYDEDHVELNVIQHHLGGDGKSMLILIQDIMDNLSHPEKLNLINDNQERCVEVYDDDYDEQFVELNEVMEQALNSMNKRWKAEKKVFHYDDREKVFNSFWADRKVKDEHLELKKEELHILLRACREHNVTLNNLIATIINKSLVQAERMGIIADVREEDNKKMGNYVDVFMLEENYDYTKDLWENVRHVDELAKKHLEDRTQLLLGNLVRNKIENGLQDANHFYDFDNSIVDEYNDNFFVGKDGLPIVLTNIGVAPIRQQYGDFGIEKIQFISPLSLRTYCNIAVITMNDVFILNMLIFEGEEKYEKMFSKIKEEIKTIIKDSKSE